MNGHPRSGPASRPPDAGAPRPYEEAGPAQADGHSLLAGVEEELARLSAAMHQLERWRRALVEAATQLRTGAYTADEVRALLKRVGVTHL
jgi:hypothetical protein